MASERTRDATYGVRVEGATIAPVRTASHVRSLLAQAQAARRIGGFADLDGLEFVARIDIGSDTNGDDKNEVRAAVTPDHKGYAAAMGAAGMPAYQPAVPAAPPAYAPAVPPAATAAAPASSTRPSWAR